MLLCNRPRGNSSSEGSTHASHTQTIKIKAISTDGIFFLLLKVSCSSALKSSCISRGLKLSLEWCIQKWVSLFFNFLYLFHKRTFSVCSLTRLWGLDTKTCKRRDPWQWLSCILWGTVTSEDPPSLSRIELLTSLRFIKSDSWVLMRPSAQETAQSVVRPQTEYNYLCLFVHEILEAECGSARMLNIFFFFL